MVPGKTMVTGKGFADRMLTDAEIYEVMRDGLEPASLRGKRVLLIVPDGTRSGPIDVCFRFAHELLWGHVAALDVLIALGTHKPMSDEAICQRLGTTPEEMRRRYGGVRVFNHRWDLPETFMTVGQIPADDIAAMCDGMLRVDVPITINRMLLDYDRVIIGPVFPHEVVGFSGGNKYFFPGVSGPEIIHLSHWLSALVTNYETIGRKQTAVRRMIDRAATFIRVPKMACCLVVKGDGLAGLYVGPVEEAWSQAADLSARVHIKYVDQPYQRILAVMPAMYEDFWTASKGMYKTEPAVADGGEIIIYAPHITEFSYTHGRVIREVGFHVRDYFVKQWDRFKHHPWGVLAHTALVKGQGTYENGVEEPRIQVSLSTQIPEAECRRLNLGYHDPASIQPEALAAQGDPGVLVVPHAGEVLHRIKQEA